MTDYTSTTWQLVTALLVFVIGFVASRLAARFLQVTPTRSALIYLWHTVFCFVYMAYVTAAGGDALEYFRQALEGTGDFSLGGGAVRSFTHFLVGWFGLSFLGASLVFNTIGCIGVLAFDAALSGVVALNSRRVQWLATLVIFLPSVSFWSSGIGKDAVVFMGIGLVLWSSIFQRNNLSPVSIFGLMLVLLVRPHIAGIMILAKAGSMIVEGGVSLPRRLMFGAATVIAAAVIVPYAMQYVGLGAEAGGDEVMGYIEQRQGINLSGGSSIDIASMSVPEQLFAYFFRPLPNEAWSSASLAAALENLLVLLVFLVAIFNLMAKRRLPSSARWQFLVAYASVGWLISAMTTANLGIAVREKWMFFPMVLALLLPAIGKRQKIVKRAKSRESASIPRVASDGG